MREGRRGGRKKNGEKFITQYKQWKKSKIPLKQANEVGGREELTLPVLEFLCDKSLPHI